LLVLGDLEQDIVAMENRREPKSHLVGDLRNYIVGNMSLGIILETLEMCGD